MSEQEYIDSSLDRSESLTDNGGFYEEIQGMSEARAVGELTTNRRSLRKCLKLESGGEGSTASFGGVSLDWIG
jgi:hypothetical protein